MPAGVPDGFEWDDDKAESNLAKHAVAFEDAVRVFDGPTLDVATITRAELRIKSIGLVNGLELAVVYTVRDRYFRIISARRANKDERKAYDAAFPR